MGKRSRRLYLSPVKYDEELVRAQMYMKDITTRKYSNPTKFFCLGLLISKPIPPGPKI